MNLGIWMGKVNWQNMSLIILRRKEEREREWERGREWEMDGWSKNSLLFSRKSLASVKSLANVWWRASKSDSLVGSLADWLTGFSHVNGDRLVIKKCVSSRCSCKFISQNLSYNLINFISHIIYPEEEDDDDDDDLIIILFCFLSFFCAPCVCLIFLLTKHNQQN